MQIKKLTITLLLMIPASIKIVSANVIDNLFRPFRGVDIPRIYDSYSSIIDFIIYSVLFIGLAQATLGKRFESQGSRAVVSTVGLALAIGLAMSERSLGFNIRSFGPLAAGMFIFLVGFMLYSGIKTAGANTVNAGSIALVITYFSIAAVVPGFFDWIMRNPSISWIHSIVTIALVVLVFKILKRLFTGKKDKLHKAAKKLMRDSYQGERELSEQIDQEKKEKKFIKKGLEKINKQASGSSKEILTDLLELRKMVEEFGGTEQGRYLIVAKLEAISPEEQRISKNLALLKQRIQKLSNFDYRHFQKLRDEYHNLSVSARKQIEVELKDEWKKIDAEKKIIKLEDAAEVYNRDFMHAIQTSVASLRANRVQHALALIDEAIAWEERIQKIFKEMEHLERRLKYFTGHEIKAEKRQLKQVKKARAEAKV
ncbi:hypothetical protein IH785_16285 [candidate division KSB1 bacterium]|nr:hypothetical protein [candidate division KSB1 bacterium]